VPKLGIQPAATVLVPEEKSGIRLRVA